MEAKKFLLGCEALIQSPPSWFHSCRLGLLANQASVGSGLKNVKDMIRDAGGRLSCIFSPQHGFYSEKQANMIESADSRDPDLEIPVVSLYSESREPSHEALQKIDTLLIDLQDIGTRVYTYTVTIGLCIEAAERTGTKIVILDRPNPINGMEIEGNLLDADFRSFVGRYRVPMRHGLTAGEFAGYVRAEGNIDCDLTVIPMQGWRRSSYFGDLGLHWVFPSPNMPTWETALLYPGMVLLEGTNISEGRGTTMPFQLFGAPFLNQRRILEHLEGSGLEGITFRPVTFEPAFDKHKSVPCFGFQMHITDGKRFRPYRTGLALLQAFCSVHPDRFRWLDPPYEYEWEKLPIDILIGSGPIRRRLEGGEDLGMLESEWEADLQRFRDRCAPCLLYPK
ncbi:MAG: exo-beta-N-acetylmuramidase NamZ domain-containing protein [Syntrophobacteraceae bacterium]